MLGTRAKDYLEPKTRSVRVPWGTQNQPNLKNVFYKKNNDWENKKSNEKCLIIIKNKTKNQVSHSKEK